MDQQAKSELQQGSQNPVVTDDEIDLIAILGALLDKRLIIISFTAVAILLSVAVAVVSTPIYQAGALLQVEEKTASLPGLEDLAEAFASESSTQAELEIIKSRSVIGAAVENLSLTTIVEPKRFPLSVASSRDALRVPMRRNLEARFLDSIVTPGVVKKSQ